MSDGGDEITNYVELICSEHKSEVPELRFPWELMSISIDVDDHSKFAHIIFDGKDFDFWIGAKGPRFGYCFARILINNETSGDTDYNAVL